MIPATMRAKNFWRNNLTRQATRVIVVTSLHLGLPGCAPEKNVAVSTPNPPIAQDQDMTVEPDINITSKTLGGWEEAWIMIYWTFKYYGFDDAASTVTNGTIEDVNARPFSPKDKTDFKGWILDAQSKLVRYAEKFANLATRPDMPDGPSRRKMAKDAKIIQSLKPSELCGGTCQSGGGFAI